MNANESRESVIANNNALLVAIRLLLKHPDPHISLWTLDDLVEEDHAQQSPDSAAIDSACGPALTKALARDISAGGAVPGALPEVVQINGCEVTFDFADLDHEWPVNTLLRVARDGLRVVPPAPVVSATQKHPKRAVKRRGA